MNAGVLDKFVSEFDTWIASLGMELEEKQDIDASCFLHTALGPWTP